MAELQAKRLSHRQQFLSSLPELLSKSFRRPRLLPRRPRRSTPSARRFWSLRRSRAVSPSCLDSGAVSRHQPFSRKRRHGTVSSLSLAYRGFRTYSPSPRLRCGSGASLLMGCNRLLRRAGIDTSSSLSSRAWSICCRARLSCPALRNGATRDLCEARTSAPRFSPPRRSRAASPSCSGSGARSRPPPLSHPRPLGIAMSPRPASSAWLS